MVNLRLVCLYSFSRAGINSSDISPLPQVLQSSHITTLDLSHNGICESETPLLATMVTIRHLSLSTCLADLDLSYNRLALPVIHGIAEALKNNNLKLTKLKLDSCSITAEAALPFATSLPLVTCLKYLSMSRNRLGVLGMQVPIPPSSPCCYTM